MPFPCSFVGILSLSLSWTLLEFPINMVGLVSLLDLHLKIDNQFISLCLTHSPLPVGKCLSEITSVLDKIIEQRCIDQKDDHPESIKQSKEESLLRFRQYVANSLSLEKGVDWTNDDLDHVRGWEYGKNKNQNDPLDHCDTIWSSIFPHSYFDDHEVFVVGHVYAIDRDYLIRDILGCIPKVRYCVESIHEKNIAETFLSYEQNRRNSAASIGILTSSSVGYCEPSPTNKVVLIRNVNRYGDSETQDIHPLTQVLMPLFDKWKPDIFIHQSEEIPREIPNEFQSLYARAKLVLRPYHHHHEPLFLDMLTSLYPNLVMIPLGYGTGFQQNYSSGLNLAFSHIGDMIKEEEEKQEKQEGSSEDRHMKWAFVGRTSVHRSRLAMSNVFTSSNWGPYERHVDLSGSFATGPLTPTQVAHIYSEALFVPSPPGNSPECFRHYEAMIQGAIPIVEGRPTDYYWWCGYHGINGSLKGLSQRQQERCNKLEGQLGLGPFPAPVGILLTNDMTSSSIEHLTSVEVMKEREKDNNLGFELDIFTLFRHEETEQSLERDWTRLLERAKNMGSEEIQWRRNLNARFYIGTITEIRKRVHKTLFVGT